MKRRRLADGPVAPSCLYQLRNTEVGYTLSSCVTGSQHATLFGRRRPRTPKALGCGNFACAYPLGKDKVVKITTDPSDVGALQRAQGLPGVPVLYRAFRLKTPEGGRYAMVLERLRTLSKGRRYAWRTAIACAREQGAGTANQKLYPEQPETNSCCELIHDKHWLPDISEQGKCRRMVHEVVAAKAALKEQGIRFTDWTPNNIGQDKHGRWKILDLGVTGRGPEREPRELAGRNRKKPRR